MKQKILRLMAILALAIAPVALVASPAYAACGSPSTSKNQVLNGIGGTGGDCDPAPVNNLVATVVNIMSIIVGIAAIIVVILAGFKYITSGGEGNKVANAKSTLIYALIGLVIAVLAQFLVHFVLVQARNASAAPCPTGQSLLATGSCG